VLGVIGAVLGIVTSLAQLGGVSAASIAVDVVIYAVILWYLWQPSIQRAFGRNV
jgi:flagellar motor component MotA